MWDCGTMGRSVGVWNDVVMLEEGCCGGRSYGVVQLAD